MNRRHLTLAAIAGTLGLTYGVWYSYSVFLVALLREFGWSRSVLAGAFSVFTLVHGGANPLVGMLCDRIGPRRLVVFGGVALGLALYGNSFIDSPGHLYLGFGLFTALAVACSGWVPAVVMVQRQFMDRLGLSLGIVSSGIGLGMLLVVPLCEALIESLGWRSRVADPGRDLRRLDRAGGAVPDARRSGAPRARAARGQGAGGAARTRRPWARRCARSPSG